MLFVIFKIEHRTGKQQGQLIYTVLLSLIFVEVCQEFHCCPNAQKALLAFINLSLISISEIPCWAILLPKYVN